MADSLSEIEREQALERLRDGVRVGKWINDKRQFERLWDDVSFILSALTASEAEVERMREALRQIAEAHHMMIEPDLKAIARAALTGEKP